LPLFAIFPSPIIACNSWHSSLASRRPASGHYVAWSIAAATAATKVT